MGKIVAAFEVWHNGPCMQMSDLYLASEVGKATVENFIEGNKDSFADLYTFEDEEEAIKEYYKLRDEMEEYNDKPACW